eukprot:5840098-Amphidinium_carterae.1
MNVLTRQSRFCSEESPAGILLECEHDRPKRASASRPPCSFRVIQNVNAPWGRSDDPCMSLTFTLSPANLRLSMAVVSVVRIFSTWCRKLNLHATCYIVGLQIHTRCQECCCCKYLLCGARTQYSSSSTRLSLISVWVLARGPRIAFLQQCRSLGKQHCLASKTVVWHAEHA